MSALRAFIPLTGVVVVIAAIVAFVVMRRGAEITVPSPSPTPLITTSSPTVSPAQNTTQQYRSATHRLSFQYPSRYFLTERSVGTPTRPQTALVLAEDTPDNRALMEGRVTEPREGPTTITIDIYANPNQLTAQQWIEQDTTWTLSDQRLTPITVAGQSGLAYTWSGLYEGKSTVVTSGPNTYVISVTWLTPTDRILQDYQTVLASLAFQG